MTESRWILELTERYPLSLAQMLQPHDPPHQPITLFGFECREGWRHLITRLLDRLEAEIAAKPESARSGTYVSQIKEKFGGLRFYVNGGVSEEMQAAIRVAGDESLTICEVCGAAGKAVQSPRGWVRTVCPDHAGTLGTLERPAVLPWLAAISAEQRRLGRPLTWVEQHRLRPDGK
jgi:hypothetical protein